MLSRQKLLQYKVHHVLFWILFGLVWYYLRYQDYATWKQATLVTAVKVIDLMFLVYMANYLLIPKLLYRKRYLLFSLLLIGMIAASSSLKMYIIGHLINNPALYQWTNQVKARIYDNVIPHIFLVIAGMAFKLLMDYNQMQKRLLQGCKRNSRNGIGFFEIADQPALSF